MVAFEQYQLMAEINSLLLTEEMHCRICEKVIKKNKDKALHIARHWKDRQIPQDWHQYIKW